MGYSATELRRRARADVRELAKRREAIAIEAVARHDAAEQARTMAEAATAAAREALAAASVTFGGPEKAAAVTGIDAAEFRAARREVTAEQATAAAESMATPSPSARRQRQQQTPRTKETTPEVRVEPNALERDEVPCAGYASAPEGRIAVDGGLPPMG